MDNRQPRPLIHNPNHQPPPQGPLPPSQSTIYQPPSSSQPPVQIPFSDPFQRRGPDPFMPSAQSQRRGSYGIPPSRDAAPNIHGERASLVAGWPPSTSAPNTSQLPPQQSQQPPPPPPLSGAHTSSTPAPYGLDPARRRSLGGGQSPPRYYGPNAESQPLPAPFGVRQMLPPSPSQQNPGMPGYQPRQQGPPPPPTFGGSGRDLPGLGPPGRPGNGISISSILGGDPSTSQPPHSQPHHSSPTTTRSPAVSAMQPPSPRRPHSQSLGSRYDFSWKRPSTPERASVSSGPRMPDASTFSASSSPRHFAARGSPEYTRANPSFGQHQYPVAPPQVSRPYQSSPNDVREREAPRHPDERVPPRPNSQPIGFALPPRDEHRDGHASIPPREPLYRTIARPDEQRPPPTVSSPYGTQPPAATSRDRQLTAQPPTHSAYSPPHEQKHDDRLPYGVDYGRDPGVRKDEYPPFRTGFRNTYLSSPHGQSLGSLGSHAPEPPRSHPQVFDPFRRPQESQPPVLNNADAIHGLHGGGIRSQPPETVRRDTHPEAARTALSEQQARGPGEEMQRSRSWLSIGSDVNRRGRASPLPQAVQGAQAQMSGPSSDPNIKSEFGRIFQGLPSGFGGHVPGSSTPSRQSPMPQQRCPDDAIALSDNDGLKMARGGSRSGNRKGRSIKDEDRLETESNDGRGTPSGRGNKRPRISHHHHLPHNQPHHHHVHGIHHGPPDDMNQPYPFANRLNPPTTSGTPTAPHHHHHIHHHHHPAKAPQFAPMPPARKPQIKINSQAVLDMVKDRPRNHLGSELYAPQVSPVDIPSATLSPTNIGTNAGTQRIYRSIYKPSREFSEQDWNCTFTVRVPRYFLMPTEREKICADANLWGTSIYTDDSDPVAMAIHNGWIRGEWSDDVDASLLDIPAPPPPSDSLPEEIDAVPPAPVIPPPDCEAHITLLILPTLQRYQGAVMNGLKSRNFGPPPKGSKEEKQEQERDLERRLATHDGCSWMITKIKWVDERGDRGYGRTGKEKRRRRADKREAAAADALLSLLAGTGVASGRTAKGMAKQMEMEGVELGVKPAAVVA